MWIPLTLLALILLNFFLIIILFGIVFQIWVTGHTALEKDTWKNWGKVQEKQSQKCIFAWKLRAQFPNYPEISTGV